MAIFIITMQVTYLETWTVDAQNEHVARELAKEPAESIEMDDTGGEMIDWDIVSIKKERAS